MCRFIIRFNVLRCIHTCAAVHTVQWIGAHLSSHLWNDDDLLIPILRLCKPPCWQTAYDVKIRITQALYNHSRIKLINMSDRGLTVCHVTPSTILLCIYSAESEFVISNQLFGSKRNINNDLFIFILLWEFSLLPSSMHGDCIDCFAHKNQL